jgi:PAS domain S-box-containing protein
VRASKPPLTSGTVVRPSPTVAGPAVGPGDAPIVDAVAPPAPLPGADLLGSVWNGSQAIYVLDGQWTVEAWNPAAEALWGIAAEQARGRLIDDLVDWQPVSGPGRDLGRFGRGDGRWSERRLDRPRVGSRVGELIVVDTSVAAERGPAAEDGPGVGHGPAADVTRIVVSAHDVTRSVDLAAEMAAFAALGTDGGGIRDRHAVAREALQILGRTTGADEGIVVLFHETYYETLAEIHEGRLAAILSSMEPGSSPVLNALKPGSVMSTDPRTLALRDDVRTVLDGVGLRWTVTTALWSGDNVAGLLSLGWIRDRPREPAEVPVLEAATHLSAALENARLIEELSARYEASQVLSARLEALVELARLPETSDPVSLAESVTRQLIWALEAVAGGLWRAGPEHWEPDAQTSVDARVRDLVARTPIADLPDWGPEGTDPYVESYDGANSHDPIARAALGAGYRSRAVFPVADVDPPNAALVLWFDRPADQVAVDERALQAIGRSISVAFANHRLRAEIQASEQRYRTLFTDAPEAYVVTTVSGVITDMNPHAERLYRTGPRGLVGRRIDEIADIDPAEYARRDAAMEQDGRATFIGVGRRIDGSVFAQQLNVRRIMLDGEPRNLVNLRDTTEPDRLQAELLQAQKMEAVGQLVAGVAHELNNPLQAIIGFSKLLGNDPTLPAELRSDAGLLVAEATRTKRIVENLLNFARHRPPERYPTRLGLLVQSILDLQSYQLFGGITVEVDIPDDLPPVPLDRAMMQQVILNLTQNAIQAIRGASGHGTLRIAAWLGENETGATVARLAFADDGPGIADENRDRVFLPFFTTKEPGDGTGLGLSVSFAIVAGHGGRLWFEPGPGGGSIFTIELPLAPAATDGTSPIVPVTDYGTTEAAVAGHPDEPRPPGSAETRRLRILVLDDEETIRTFLVRVLRGSVDVVAAGSGADALRLIEESDFDGILCDHRMPGMTGTEVYERIATLRPSLAGHFVLMSGDVLNPELLAFAEGRAVRLLSKPFEIETLQSIIAEMSADVVAAGR